MLLAAPFILDLEHGTYRLAWTQSITRGRWLAGKLGLAAISALLVGGALTLLINWWRAPEAHLNGRLLTGIYDSDRHRRPRLHPVRARAGTRARGVMATLGPLRLTVAFIGYFVARVLVDTWLRQRLVTPLKATWRAVAPGIPGPSRVEAPANLHNAWVISERPSDKLGHPVSLQIGDCSRVAAGHIKKMMVDGNCLLQNGADFMHAVYHPASRFWLFQGIETALFGTTALALILFAAWWTHQRTT